MGLLISGERVNVSPKIDSFSKNREISQEHEVKELPIITSNTLLIGDKYSVSILPEVNVSAETETDTTTTVDTGTATRDLYLTSLTFSWLRTAGTVTYIRFDIQILAPSGDVHFAATVYGDTNNPIQMALPLNNIIVKEGDTVRISRKRTTVGADYRYSFTLTHLDPER